MLTLECTYLWCIEVKNELEMGVILETLASLYMMARCDEGLNDYGEVECPLVRRRLQTA